MSKKLRQHADDRAKRVPQSGQVLMIDAEKVFLALAFDVLERLMVLKWLGAEVSSTSRMYTVMYTDRK